MDPEQIDDADAAKSVDKICDRFEAAWRGGASPRIEEFLDEIPDSRRESLLRELLLLEWALRGEASQAPRLEDYQQRFPDRQRVVLEAWGELHRFSSGAVAGSTAATVQTLPDSRAKTLESNDVSADTLVGDLLADGAGIKDGVHIDRYEIRKKLGEGAYGLVYEAFDPQLGRRVALKVPKIDEIKATELAGSIHEARHAVAVETDGIVRVLDIRLDHSPPFIVMEFVDGGSLKDRLEEGPFSPADAVAILIRLAVALGHAHRQSVFHLDLKPANILLDKQGLAYITDFGFAIHQSQRVRYQGFPTGTPAYMSPEQARRESNKFDGSTDIWSLGVIFYEMVTGRRPFSAGNLSELYQTIRNATPQRPRQLDPSIPAELERICLKCLAPQQSERYATTNDLADDLRWFQEQEAATASTKLAVERVREATAPVRPQGLRSFTAKHADFFLSLLPGPRDREGLPESISFWKQRIESGDAQEAFAVGVIFGPSGCGKSSFVAAGLLPTLASHVSTMQLSCNPDQTEADLAELLRNRCPGLTGQSSLPEMLATLRDDATVRGSQRKVLIVLEQFEQWLHGWEEDEPSPLVEALRHCDGVHVQCLLSVRADFFHSLSSFMRQLDVPLREGVNLAGVDLFDKQHAARVLELFGQALGKLDETPGIPQRAFLTQVVDEVAEEGKVICVRLAVIAEMMKHREWTSDAWLSVGRAAGIGEAFLEETFSSGTASPTHREHQDAARRVLRALLPDSDVEIKGGDRGYEELLSAARYENRPQEFAELLGILDDELRLITPVERHSGRPAEDSTVEPGGEALTSRRYQLSHDFLVPSLRNWLTRKQRESPRGRAELLLSERSMWWSARPERRFLPSLPEWIQIRRWTKPSRWTEEERGMMRRADRRILVRGLALGVAACCVLTVVLAVGWQRRAELRGTAKDKLEDLSAASLDNVPDVFDNLLKIAEKPSLHPWLLQQIDDRLKEVELAPAHPRLRLAKVAISRDEKDLPLEDLLTFTPEQAIKLRGLIPQTLRPSVNGELWKGLRDLTDDRTLSPQQISAAIVLAGMYDVENDNWKSLATPLAGWLTQQPANTLLRLIDGLRPVADPLRIPLKELAIGDAETTVRYNAVLALTDYAELAAAEGRLAEKGYPKLLLEVALAADERQLVELLPMLASSQAAPQHVAELCREQLRLMAPADLREEREIVNLFKSAGGVLDREFAWLPPVPLADFEQLTRRLKKHQYRPYRVRPVFGESQLLVAAAWTKDGFESYFEHSLSAADLHKKDKEMRRRNCLAADLSVHATTSTSNRDRYACLWVRDDSRRLAAAEFKIDLTLRTLREEQELRETTGWRVAAVSVAQFATEERFAALWEKPEERPEEGTSGLGQRLALGAVPWDLALAPGFQPDDGAMTPESITPGGSMWRLSQWLSAPRSQELSDDVKHGGQYSARLHAGSRNDVMLRQRVRVQPGRSYLFSSWVKTEDVTIEEVGGKVGATLSWSGDADVDPRPSITHSTDWQYVAVKIQPASPFLELGPRLGFTYSTAQGTAWFDDLSLVLLDEADAGDASGILNDPEFPNARRNLLANGGFESPPSLMAWRRSSGWEYRTMTPGDPERRGQRAAELASHGFRPITWWTSPAEASSAGQLQLSSVWQRSRPTGASEPHPAVRTNTNAAVVLADCASPQEIAYLFAADADRTTRSHLVHRLWLAENGRNEMLDLAKDPETDPAIRQGLLLSLGPSLPSLPDRRELRDVLQRIQETTLNDGVLSAVEWLMRQMSDAEPSPSPGLTSGVEGHRLVAFPEPSRDFLMGSSQDNVAPLHACRIPRPFAIAACEVTRKQFDRFVKAMNEHGRSFDLHKDNYTSAQRCPQNFVSWYFAAMYCRWLGEVEGIDESEQCYPSLEEIWHQWENRGGATNVSMRLEADCLQRTGYRLPTEAEWEYACRAGARTPRFFGEGTYLLREYAVGSEPETRPVGEMKPNLFGLFDTLGNASEWCHSRFGQNRNDWQDDFAPLSEITVETQFNVVMRGGGFSEPPAELTSANRQGDPPTAQNYFCGFRIARTLRADD